MFLTAVEAKVAAAECEAAADVAFVAYTDDERDLPSLSDASNAGKKAHKQAGKH